MNFLAMMYSRRKGPDGERELARILRAELGIKIERNLEQTRDGGYDLIGADFAIEVKRARSIKPSDISGWWEQTLRQAKLAELPPVLAYRQDRRPWVVRVPMSVLHQDLPGSLIAEIDLGGFCFILKNRLGEIA